MPRSPSAPGDDTVLSSGLNPLVCGRYAYSLKGSGDALEPPPPLRVPRWVADLSEVFRYRSSGGFTNDVDRAIRFVAEDPETRGPALKALNRLEGLAGVMELLMQWEIEKAIGPAVDRLRSYT